MAPIIYMEIKLVNRFSWDRTFKKEKWRKLEQEIVNKMMDMMIYMLIKNIK